MIIMRGRTSGHITRENIIRQSFILFCTKQYEEVTYPDIEQATGLRRGSILYHFKTKQELFDAVVESMLLDTTNLLNIPLPEGDVLKNFIDGFIDNGIELQKSMAAHGIENVFLAYMIIASNAFCHFQQFDKRLRQMRKVELGVWLQVVNKAIEKGEISNAVEANLLARLFVDTYYGHAASALREDRKGEIQVLQKELMALYNLVKSKPVD